MSHHIHKAYDPRQILEPFAGTFKELRGGEYLGPTAQPHIMQSGAIITSVYSYNDDGHGSHIGYYYDPKLLIKGTSYVWAKFSNADKNTWIKVIR